MKRRRKHLVLAALTVSLWVGCGGAAQNVRQAENTKNGESSLNGGTPRDKTATSEKDSFDSDGPVTEYHAKAEPAEAPGDREADSGTFNFGGDSGASNFDDSDDRVAEEAAPRRPRGDPAPTTRTKPKKSNKGKEEGRRRPAPEPEAVFDELGGLGTRAGKGGGGSGKAYDPTRGEIRPAPAPQAPSITAGRHDDNAQYNRFLSFVDQHERLVPYPVDISERLVMQVVDKDGKSKHNCKVDVKRIRGGVLSTTTTYADGRTMFFPAAQSSPKDKEYTVQAKCGRETRNGQLRRGGEREVKIAFNTLRKLPARIPVDIAIVLDTTGSMGGQIQRLKETLKAIHFQLTNLSSRPDVRFALVAYRDQGDEYRTQLTHFTGDVNAFQRLINNLDADGGGDTPEDLQEALKLAHQELKWRRDALRIGFIVADAPPHTDYGQKFNYREAMKDALARGIKWVSVGAGGLPIDGELVFRQIAQYTMGEYVFVTQGRGGDAEGSVGEASHHVGSNYKTENLDQAIVRIVRRELSYLTDTPKDFDNTIVATAPDTTPRDVLLAPAAAEVMRQLADYSAMQIEAGTRIVIAPVGAPSSHATVAEYLTEQMQLSVSRNPSFRLIERDLNAVAKELKLQSSDLFETNDTVVFGKFLGADVMVVAKLTQGAGSLELFAKLIRVETGEVLSVAKAEIRGAGMT